MEQSILTSTKKILGIGPDDNSFDLDVITHINSAFSTLNQLGIGPERGFIIEDESKTWTEFIGDDPIKQSMAKNCVYLRVKLLFDPPTTSFHLDALNKQIQEADWRINVQREETEWPAQGGGWG